MSKQKKKVLFLCTGNSCRSQMAEAIVRSDFGDDWESFSAGTQPAGYVHPLALKVLLEMGIHHEGVSKSVDAYRDMDFDLVVTVCDEAAETCPVWLGAGKRIHQGYPDPAGASGSEDEILLVFRTVRDKMLDEIPEILAGLND